MNIKIKLKYGDEEIAAVLSGGRFLGEIRPNPLPELTDAGQEIINSLRVPIGSRPLQSLVGDARSVAIVISDHTRPLSAERILPLLISELEGAGINRDSVTVIIGVGNHHPVTVEEEIRLLGPVYGQVKCVHSRESGYKLLGITKRGTPIEVAEPVANAGFVAAIGNIEHHQMAGYTGGVKAVAVGAASPRAIENNHRLNNLQDSGFGILEGNIVRQDMEEFARITNLRFIVNVILNEFHRLVAVVAGDPVSAHRAGCAVADRLYRVRIEKPADIVIISPGGRPKDDTVYQAQKSVQNAVKAVKNGGIIVVAAKCGGGLGDPVFEAWMNEAVTPKDLEARSAREFALGGHKGALIAKAVQRAEIYWVSDMEPACVRRLFFKPYASLQEAVDAALRRKGENAGVLVMPFGGLTVPFSHANSGGE